MEQPKKVVKETKDKPIFTFSDNAGRYLSTFYASFQKIISTKKNNI